MTINTLLLSRCDGLGHYSLEMTIAGQTFNFLFQKGDAEVDFTDRDEVRELIIGRLRSAVKESGATNWQQVKTALENKTFKL